MIRLTNAQASLFNSPVISNLFQDSGRPFPIDASFGISAAVTEIQKKLIAYQEAIGKIREKHKGAVIDNTRMEFPPETREAAMEDLKKLNDAELEYSIVPIQVQPDWPRLTLAEATILQPILRMNDGKKEAPTK